MRNLYFLLLSSLSLLLVTACSSNQPYYHSDSYQNMKDNQKRHDDAVKRTQTIQQTQKQIMTTHRNTSPRMYRPSNTRISRISYKR